MTSLSVEPKTEQLNGLSALDFLSQAEVESLLPYVAIHEVSSGEVLWQETEDSSFAAIVLDGRFEEKKLTEFASKQIVVGVYGRGAMVGESSLLDNLTCPLTVSCLVNGRLLILSRDRLHALQLESPQVALQIYKAATQSLSIKLDKSFKRLSAIF